MNNRNSKGRVILSLVISAMLLVEGNAYVNNMHRIYAGDDNVDEGMSYLSENEEAFETAENVKATEIVEPQQLYSLSAVLMDAQTGRVLYEKDGYTVRANASTTKIMTCILALESGKLDELVTVSKYAASMPDVQLGINEGEQYLLSDLLYSLMLESHNDVAVAIAEHISEDVVSFAKLMNEKAKEIGCENTNFITPNGLDASEETEEGIKIHGTTAADLAKIMAYCIKNEEFLKITQTATYTFSNRTTESDGTQKIGSRKYTVNNKNAFLNMMEGVLSGKTGYTNDAGYCYVAALENDGRTYTIALLGCGWPNNKTYKWSDAGKLFNYGLEYYEISDFFEYDMSFEELEIKDGVYGKYEDFGINGINADKTPYVSVYVEEEALNFLHRSDEVPESEVIMNLSRTAPVYKGEVVGRLVYSLNGRMIKEYEIKVAEDVKRKDFEWALTCVLNKFLIH